MAKLVGLPGFRKVTKSLADWSGLSLVSAARGLSAGLLAVALTVYLASFALVGAIPLIEYSWLVRIGLSKWPSFILAFLFALSVWNFVIILKKERL
jgi:hypothetical protein